MNNEEYKPETKQSNTFYAPVIGNANVGEMRDSATIEFQEQTYSSEEKKSLAETAAEIQKLLDQLSQTSSNQEEAKQKTAEELATRAQKNPLYKEALKKLGISLGNKAGEVAVTEVVKQSILMTLGMLV